MILCRYHDMELRHLRYFVAVAETLNVRRAAERLHVSQPPLSRQLRDLEEEMGARLFVRTKQGMQLTEAGRFFLKETREILAKTQRALDTVQSAKRGEIGRLTLAYDGSFSDPRLTRVIRQFRQRFPAVDLTFSEMPTHQQIRELLDQHIDLGYLGLRFTELEKELQFEFVSNPAVWLVLPPGHRLARQRKIRLPSLANEPFVAPPRTAFRYRELLLQYCRAAGFEPRMVHESNNGQCMLEMVSAGMGVAVVPESFRRLFAIEVEYRPLALTKSPLEIHIAWHRENHSPVLRSFLEMFREQVHPAGERG